MEFLTFHLKLEKFNPFNIFNKNDTTVTTLHLLIIIMCVLIYNYLHKFVQTSNLVKIFMIYLKNYEY